MSKSKNFIENIAVVGLAGRFPGAENIDQFWHNLREGIESIHRFTAQELESMGVPPEVFNQPDYVKAGTLLKNAYMFDSDFFGFNPKEASLTDPQHRIFLECAWEAIENAGYNVESRIGPIGVFAGASPNYYSNMIPFDYDTTLLVEAYQREIGNEKDYLCTLVSYKLNLKGPSLTIQTSCSTSLVAVCLACQSLLNYQCDMALAGGVCVNTRHRAGYFYQEGLIPSPDGHCRAFDARAKGTVLGQGAGIVVLKRLSDAIADGDTICAVIKGSAINNDGSVKVGYTAPSVNGQAEVIAMAQALSGISPENISYIETHGTGTQLGDPIEIAALSQVFRETTNKKGFCAIGSVKSNIGHLDAAAGVVSLIKTILMLKHKEIPPILHFEKPNPNIDFENSPFYVNTELREWKNDKVPLRAGVSSFGIGGTNAHVVLEEAPEMETSGQSRKWQLLPLSAKTQTALDAATINLADYLKRFPEYNLADVAYTLSTGRKAFNRRRIVVCSNTEYAIAKLESPDTKESITSIQEPIDREIIFMFSGQASEYVNMGLDLHKTEPKFRECVDYCVAVLKSHHLINLRNILCPDDTVAEEAAEKLKLQSITQPALFVIEYALAKLWMSWGINPAALVGHSIGEYTAACLAGVFPLEDALSLVATRGRLMENLPPGAMLAVFLHEEEIKPYLNENLSIAVINGPSLCVVSGETKDIEDLENRLSSMNVDYRRLHTSHAFHSKMTDPFLDTFADVVKKVALNPPQIPFVSNVTGTWIKTEEAANPDYWVRHLRHTVRFSDCIEELLKDPNRLFLEVGPGQTLSTLVRQHPNRNEEHLVFSSIRHPNEQKSDVAFILSTLGQLWLSGIQIDWSGFYEGEKRNRIPLPTYPFERRRYWEEAGKHVYPTVEEEFVVSEDERKEIIGGKAPLEGKKEKTYVNDFTSKDDVVKILTDMWQDLLGVKPVDFHDNFFDLGGHSLIALRLFSRIEKTFGKRLPLATLFDAPTVDQLSDLLVEKEYAPSWASLVKIQSGGSKPPFFCVHSEGGNVLEYQRLAQYLGQDQPFYALQARGLEGIKTEATSVEKMASHYIKEIKTLQPEGPYYIGGYCLGGLVAFEMARQLESEDEKIALLALISASTPDHLKNEVPNITVFRRLFYRVIERTKLEINNLSVLASRAKISYIQERFRRGWLLFKLKYEDVVDELSSALKLKPFLHSRPYILEKLSAAQEVAFHNYKPSRIKSRVIIFRPSRQPRALSPDPTLGWANLSEGGIIEYEVNAFHKNIMKDPNVRELADKLKYYL